MFSNPLLSLLTTVITLTREFDASNLSFDNLTYTSHVIFLLFVFLVAIILLNLLNGLAVSDTHAIRRNAATLSIVGRARLILKIEASLRALQRCMTCSVEGTIEMCTLYPKRRNKIGSTDLRRLLSKITKKRQPNEKWVSTAIQDKWAALHLRHDKLEEGLHETLQILMQILTRLEIRECKKLNKKMRPLKLRWMKIRRKLLSRQTNILNVLRSHEMWLIITLPNVVELYQSAARW